MGRDRCNQTCRALRDDRCPRIPEECIDGLLLWLCGSRNGPAQTAYRILGSPFDHPDLLERVYRALDEALFRDGELLAPDGEPERCRQRFRLLSRAFHPDRHPQLADWLGPRAQTVNAAFHAYKRDPSRQAKAAGASRPAEANQARPPARRKEPDYSGQIGLRERLIGIVAPLSHTRHLPQKVLLLTAIACAAPVAYLYQQRAQTDRYLEHRAGAENTALPAGRDPAAPDADPLATALAVLERFQDSYEDGRLHELLALIAEHPGENEHTGRGWFEQHYADLFAETHRRSLELDFHERFRDGRRIWLTGRFATRQEYPDGRTIRDSGQAAFVLIPEQDDWKISHIYYHPEAEP